MKKLIIFIAIFVSTSLLFSPVNAANPSALNLIQPDKTTEILGATNKLAGTDGAGYNTDTTIEDIVASIIKMVLTALGTIFIILIFVSGNDWMQAAGNEEKVKKSKATIRNLIIGLCLVLLAYALTFGMGGMLAGMLLAK